MEDILELILTILFLPFEKKEKQMWQRFDCIQNKWFRIFLKVLVILLFAALLFGLCCLLSYIFRGYWV